MKLMDRFVRSCDTLEKVCYFTAFPEWKPEQNNRHHKFVEATASLGVEVILGRFKQIKRFCKKCEKQYSSHEEKRTDVNLAVHLLHLAHTDAFDTAIIVSSDSDYTSAIELVRVHFPSKSIGVVFPIGQRHSDELAEVATFFRYMKIKDLKKSLLPEKIALPNGTILLRPPQYNPPSA